MLLYKCKMINNMKTLTQQLNGIQKTDKFFVCLFYC